MTGRPDRSTTSAGQSHGPVHLDAEAQLEKYRVLLGRMEATALDRDKSRDFIHNIARDL
ncbi:Scr1 family TA system antitoxin-like transcriptional regulator [Streptomyces sp. R-74717]|uniref:Scr1 family TA system antitoxin-like transcriptional regulator n=1 Tax=Streptomyces TaxID=1883 RepID=UPI0037B1D165